MTRSLLLIAPAALLMAVLLAGCDDDRPRHQAAYGEHHDPGDGAIGFDGDVVAIEAGGQPALARVGLDGHLSIGSVEVETGPEAQQALKTYGAAALAMKTHALALGRAGVSFGFDTVRDVVEGLIEGRHDEIGDQAREGAALLVAQARELCGRMDAVLAAQAAVAAAVPAFRPYAVMDAAQVRECFEEIDDEAKDPGDGARPTSSPPPEVPRAPADAA